IPEYDRKEIIRERTGSILPGITPSNIYRCKDDKYVVIGANGDSIFKRLMKLMGLPEYSDDPRFASNDTRTEHADYLDHIINKWTADKDIDEVIQLLNENDIPSGKIYSAE